MVGAGEYLAFLLDKWLDQLLLTNFFRSNAVQPTVQNQKIFILNWYKREKQEILTLTKLEKANIWLFFAR